MIVELARCRQNRQPDVGKNQSAAVLLGGQNRHRHIGGICADAAILVGVGQFGFDTKTESGTMFCCRHDASYRGNAEIADVIGIGAAGESQNLPQRAADLNGHILGNAKVKTEHAEPI